MATSLFAERRLSLPHGTLVLREAVPTAAATGRVGTGPPVPVLLLHGISSGAASWAGVAAALPGEHLLAWDAPGYGHSTPLPMDEPTAHDYAAVAQQALDALGIACVRLVGHSLGALMATALATRLGPQRVTDLLLLSPARGYGGDAAQAAHVRTQRLQALQAQGVAGLAAGVSQRLLSAAATTEHHAQVQQVAQALTPRGYAQAVHLLCSAELAVLAQGLGSPPVAVRVRVAVGAADIVTPPSACAVLAQALGASMHTLAAAGHAVAVEQPVAVADLILAVNSLKA